MSWPLSQDYNEAIQSPATNFADADLKMGEATTNALGLPVPFSGNFADVYQVRCPNGSRWAVKCFTREVAGLDDRYQEISAWLSKAKLPFSVEFSYLDQGIRVRGKWYPILKMQWVEGLTLNQFVSQYLDKPAMLEALLQLWAKMGKYLRAAKIGHCDLQHGNVLLVPGSTPNALALKLIDYDGMWLPPLVGKKTGEIGHPNYQHPQRLREATYSLEVDRFPLLLVATAMRALKADKRLWAKYDNGDNLLFKESDLADPNHSELFQELASLPDPGLVMLAAQMRAALKGRLESTVLLQDAMPETKAPKSGVGLAKAVAPVARVVAPPPKTETAFAFADAGPSSVRRKTPAAKKGSLAGLVIAAIVGAVVLLGGAAGAFYALRGSGAKKTETPSLVQTRPIETVAHEEVKEAPANEQKEKLPNKTIPAEVPNEKELVKPNEEPASPPTANEPAKTTKTKWDNLELGAARDQDGVLRLSPPSGVSTKETYSGPIEIILTARTGLNDIRLDAFNGACVIFNWANNRHELRVTRPDGNEKLESGSLVTARFRPLDPNAWYVLRWIITEDGMQVFVDDKVVFSENKRYNLSAKRPVRIRPFDSSVEVKSFEVKPYFQKPEPKSPAPDAAALAAANKEIKSVHKAEFAKRKPAELQALAAKLLQEGIDTKDKPAARFALFGLARDLAARIGGFPLAMRAIDQTAHYFNVDARELKLKAVETGARGAGTVAANARVALAVLPLVAEAEDADDFDWADRYLRIALSASRASRVAALMNWAQARSSEIEALHKAYGPVPAALQTLAGKPDDAGANLVLGTYLCLSKGDWSRGLPALAQGSDAKLKALALADLGFASDPDAQVELAKKYLTQADGASGAARVHLHRRACYWYHKAETHLKGLSRTEATKKIAEIEKTLPRQHPAIVRALYGTNNDWQDVTDRVWTLLFLSKDKKPSVKANAGTLGVPNHHNSQGKTLAVVYQVEGQTCLSITPEGGTAVIPVPPGVQDVEALWPAPGQELLVLAGRYGAEGTWVDATTQVQHLVKGSSLSGVEGDGFGLGDPVFGKAKALLVVYRYDKQTRFSAIGHKQPVELGAAAKP